MPQSIEDRKPICVAPFLSLATWANGVSIICCEDKGPPVGNLDKVGSVFELVNSEQMCATRKQIMNGEVPVGCRTCLQEAQYQPTVYHYYQQFDWEEIKADYNFSTGEVARTRYLLIALSNLCTHGCRMCFDDLSVRLSSDRAKMFRHEQVAYKPNNIDKVIQFIKTNPLHTVTFHGGNPIDEPRFLDVLSAISSDTTLEIITNGSTLSSNGVNILPHLERFDHVRFNISLDGTRETTEYIRVHSNLDTVLEHFYEVLKLQNVSVNIHNTITNLNLFDLPAYYTMLLWGQFSGADSISSYIATEPEIYSVANLPHELRRLAIDQLQDFLRVLDEATCSVSTDKQRLVNRYVSNVIRRLGSEEYNPDIFRSFLKTIKTTDQFYGFETVAPYSYYIPAYAEADEHDSSAGTLVELLDARCPYSGERSFNVNECIFAWTARFHQNCATVTIRIRLNPDPGITAAQIANLQTTWQTGIGNKWSGNFSCSTPYGSIPVVFAVQWVTANPHHVVRVRTGPARSDMTTWDTLDTGDVAAHEFGHMFGLVDEYADSACPARNPVNTGTVMDNNTGPGAQRHVANICNPTRLSPDFHFAIGLDLI